MADRGRQLEPRELQKLVDALTRKFHASPDLTANGMRHVTAGIPRLSRSATTCKLLEGAELDVGVRARGSTRGTCAPR